MVNVNGLGHVGLFARHLLDNLQQIVQHGFAILVRISLGPFHVHEVVLALLAINFHIIHALEWFRVDTLALQVEFGHLIVMLSDNVANVAAAGMEHGPDLFRFLFVDDFDKVIATAQGSQLTRHFGFR